MLCMARKQLRDATWRQDAADCIDTTAMCTTVALMVSKRCQGRTGLASMTAVTCGCAGVGNVDMKEGMSAQTTAARFASPAH